MACFAAMKIARLTILLLLPILALACGGDREPDSPEPVMTAPAALDLAAFAARDIHEPQLVFDDSGTLLLVWREKGEEGSDLYVARQGHDGGFEPAVRVNDEPATVESFPHDEMRAAFAVGSGGRVALAWSDSRGQVRTAISSDGGASFAPSVRLDQADAAAYRGFPALAFGDASALHAIWIDSRHAEGFAEEPADLFYATVVDGVVTESNLTAEQEATVCGCCRTYLGAGTDGAVRSLFRNADSDGFRDIFTTASHGLEAPTPPARIGQPLWKLEGCPMSGPIAVGDRVLWPDGSSGKKMLMEAGFGPDPAVPLFSDEARGDWSPRLSPRMVSSRAAAELVLLPGRPDSRLIERAASGDGWETVAEGLPAWATTAVYENGGLILVGSVDGVLKQESRTVGP